MYKIIMFTSLVDENGDLETIFEKLLDLPFVPQVGMSFNQGTSTGIWEPVFSRGAGNLPVVERVFWDLDNEMFVVRLSNIPQPLSSSFWTSTDKSKDQRVGYFLPYIE